MEKPQTRQERRKQRTRQKLLDAARRLIAEHGYAATGVLDITEAADVSKGTFYQYFDDKENLTRTLIIGGLDAMRARINAMMPVDGVREPARLAQMLRAVFYYAAENRDLFRIMLGRQATADLSLLALNYYTEVAEEMLVRSSDMSETPPHLPALLAQFFAGAVVRLGLWWLEDDHGLSSDEIGDIAFRLLNEGVFTMLPPAIHTQDSKP